MIRVGGVSQAKELTNEMDGLSNTVQSLTTSEAKVGPFIPAFEVSSDICLVERTRRPA